MGNENLAVIPDDWYPYSEGWATWCPTLVPATGIPCVMYSTNPQIVALDYTIVRTPGIPSIRIDPNIAGDANLAREVDSRWLPIQPGIHVVAKCWIRVLTGPSTKGYPQCGGRIGLDAYGATGYITGTAHPQGLFGADQYAGTGVQDNYVQDSNGGAWQQRTIDFIVPATIKDGGGVDRVPTSMVLWVQAQPQGAGEPTARSAWFADPELYHNPSTIPTGTTFTFPTTYQPNTTVSLNLLKI